MIGTGFLSGCTQQQSTNNKSNTITIKDYFFDPPSLNVTKGTTVTWTNQGSAQHTVVSDTEGIFTSGQISNGQSFTYTFNTTGTFDFHCGNHPSMKGKIIVE
jgi:plastocyanin